MNIKQLKKMISEEYRYWLAEQPIDTPGAPGMPGVEVGPNDINAMGGGDSEATLRQIFDMLKDYFEGGAGGADMAMPAAPAGDDMDMDMDDDMGDEEEEEEEEEEEVSEEKEKKDSKKEAKELKERFKKLANIIKG